MTSAATTKRLEYYFSYDHRARGRDILIASLSGASALLVAHMRGISEVPSLAICGVCVIFVYFVLLIRYRPYVSAVPPKSWTPVTSDEGFVIRLPLPTRRSVLAQVFLSGAAAAFLLFLPKQTVAEVVNQRLRKLLFSGKNEEASETASDAIAAGISLQPDVARAAGSTRTSSADVAQGNIDISSTPSPIPVELDNNAAITIQSPMVYFSSGKYLVKGALECKGASFAGDGPEKSIIIEVIDGNAGRPALLNYRTDRSLDTLITGMGFVASLQKRSEASVLSVEPAHGRVVLSNVKISSAWQKLDRAIWLHATFIDCTVEISGDWFELAYVSFTNCDFLFSAEISNEIRQAFQNDGFREKIFNFHP